MHGSCKRDNKEQLYRGQGEQDASEQGDGLGPRDRPPARDLWLGALLCARRPAENDDCLPQQEQKVATQAGRRCSAGRKTSCSLRRPPETLLPSRLRLFLRFCCLSEKQSLKGQRRLS